MPYPSPSDFLFIWCSIFVSHSLFFAWHGDVVNADTLRWLVRMGCPRPCATNNSCQLLSNIAVLHVALLRYVYAFKYTPEYRNEFAHVIFCNVACICFILFSNMYIQMRTNAWKRTAVVNRFVPTCWVLISVHVSRSSGWMWTNISVMVRWNNESL